MRTPPIAFTRPEDLNAAVDDLAGNLYHMFVNGIWSSAFLDAGELLKAYREFANAGQACTVVAAGEIILFTPRAAGSHEPSQASRMMQKLELNLDQPPRAF